MNIHSIIYETTREIYNVEDKLKIATIFLFCSQISGKKIAELLYTENHEKFISNLQSEFSEYEIDLSLKLNDKNIRNSFEKTIYKIKQKYDDDGYYQALFNKDPFAVVIDEIVNYDFNKLKFNSLKKEIATQLSLF